MFLEYYNLAEQPFGVAPDPRFLFLNHTYREALASLWCGTKEGRGFMALVAQPGMGKTTLLFQLLQRLRTGPAQTVFLFQTCCSSLELIRYLLQDLGILPASDLPAMHQQLNRALVREALAGRQFIFVIDEAQNLAPPVLETVRLLSDFETSRGKLMQIVLAGQPQLISTLLKPEMQQLRQRISVVTSLDPLSTSEVAQYIAHRLGVAGYRGAPLFSREALELIASESRGIPRNINNLCFGALSIGLALRGKQIGREIVEEAAADQNLQAVEKRVTASHVSRPAQDPVQPPVFLPSRFGRQVWRAAHMAIALAVVMVSLSLRMRPELRPLLPHPHGVIEVANAPAQELSSAAQTPSVETPPAVVHAAASPRPLPKDDVVVVEPGDTLRQITLRYSGRYSTTIVHELQAVNPQLINPNRIEPGQRLHLPAQWRTSASEPTGHIPEPSVVALQK